MESRRKALGRHIRRAREVAGYTRPEFGAAIGMAERSVARAEIEDGPIGTKLATAIETCLGWPSDAIRRYLDTGDERLLQVPADGTADQDRAEPAEVTTTEADRSLPPAAAPTASRVQLQLLDDEITRMRERIRSEMERAGQGEGSDPVARNALVRDAENILDRARALREEDPTP